MMINGTPSASNGLSLSSVQTPGYWKRIASCVGLCVLLGGGAAALCAPVHAAPLASAPSVAALGTFDVYVYDANNNPVQAVGAYLGFQERAVYTDSNTLIGYVDETDNTILRDANGVQIGYIVY